MHIINVFYVFKWAPHKYYVNTLCYQRRTNPPLSIFQQQVSHAQAHTAGSEMHELSKNELMTNDKSEMPDMLLECYKGQ
jgi:hypothetical protein